MRIVTWNVNGLRALLNKGAWGWIADQGTEVVCLQEIKAKPEQLSDEQHGMFGGYRVHWNPAQRLGYSGVATFTHDEPLEVDFGSGAPFFDQEGRIAMTRFAEFRLFNIYFPNGKRDHSRLQYKLDFYAKFLDLCKELHADGERIILCGDLNTAHQEIDLRNPRQNAKTSGFLPEERAWIDRYIENGLVDVFRALYPERIQYTWWTYRLNARKRNVGWRLDSFLVSEALMPYVADTVIHDDVMGSDHCPVSLELNL